MIQQGALKSTDVKRSTVSSKRMTNSNYRDTKPKHTTTAATTTNDNGLKDRVCDICAQIVPGPERLEIFAFGKCDHCVCYVCSARLRVICDQFDCPICREKLDNVIFGTSKKVCYEKFNLKNCLFNEKYKIYFENQAVSEAFHKLLRYECLKCLESNKLSKGKTKGKSAKSDLSRPNSRDGAASPSKTKLQHGALQDTKARTQDSHDDTNDGQNEGNLNNQSSSKKSNESSNNSDKIEQDSQGLLKSSDISDCVFKDVFGLKNHLNYVHKLKLCDLCLTHNKLFPFEYSYYDSGTLRKHMKEGEPKTSHRGHPNCLLCHHTLFNQDELVQHMSREHYHCHLCARLHPNLSIYFIDYNSLRDHFRHKHFLCERDNCRHEQFTSAFDTEFDYRQHLVNVHDTTSGHSRGMARQQRTITLDPAPHRARAISPSLSLRRNLPPNAAIVSTGNIATANSSRQQRPESMAAPIRQQRLPSSAEFPALGNNSSMAMSRQTSQAVPLTYNSQYPSLGPTTINRPTVGATSSTSLSQRLIAGPSSSRGSFVRSVGGGLRAAEELNEMDFPPLPEQPKVKSKKKQKANQNKDTSLRNNGEPLTLDQLINASLTLSNRNTKFNGKKSGPKAGSSKASKNVKQKPLKIQLS